MSGHDPILDLDTEVCVIGAGPAGMLIGNALLQRDIRCVVIDRRSRQEIASQGRAGSIDCKTISILEQYHLADNLLLHGRRNAFCEFRSPGRSVMFDYGAHSNGNAHYQYPQTRLVGDMIEAFTARGGQVEYSTSAYAADMGSASGTSFVKAVRPDSHLTIRCRYIAGCDGHLGIGRAIVEGAMSEDEKARLIFAKYHPFQWLTILAEAQASASHTVYASHANGFAAHMRRDERVSRFYLQTPVGESLDEWPNERIWRELHLRLAKHGWGLTEGPVLQRDILVMRSYVNEKLRHENLFLAGDAAHLVTPCGGKGLNLAVQDAAELVEVLTRLLATGGGLDEHVLASYEERRLPEIWLAQEFSCSMLDMLHASAAAGPGNGFEQRINGSRMQQLASNDLAARKFAGGYLGLSV